MKPIKQIKKFDAKISNVLNLMINSLYKKKEIFLRELISNSSDACDKLRYQAIDKPALIQNENDKLRINIQVDDANKLLIISDNGIGMDNEELINNLGTIANSGTQKFMEQLSGNIKNNTNLIGQFGVGFYSAFMVAKTITVLTSKADNKEVFKWTSDGQGEYSIERSNELLSRGTKIILKIKSSELEFLELHKIKDIIKTYSDHVSFPIIITNKNNEKETINKNNAIWKKNPSEIKKEEYNAFFNNALNSVNEPWLTMHNKIEGSIEYTSLLFIPKTKTLDLFTSNGKAKVKLYVKRVFISEEGNNLIPNYLRFLKGVVDSEDLPLNVSRETLQHNKVIHKIKNSIVKKVLNSLQVKAKNNLEDYTIFWNNFSEIIKEGLYENILEEKKQLLEICRFYSTLSQNKLISLDQYLSNMIDGQDKIYYINGDNVNSLKQHPQLEGFKKRSIEVLLFSDHIDNFWVNIVHQYKNKSFQSIINEKIDLNKLKNVTNDNYDDIKFEKNKVLISFIKDILKSNNIKDVVISSKLIDSPACISIMEGGVNPKMEKILSYNNKLSAKSARIFEINPNNPIIKKINASLLIKEKTSSLINRNIIEILYNEACLVAGYSIENPSNFALKLNALLEKIK